GPVGFGHCMLHTTAESLGEKLPCTDATGRFTITADARIDNREELLSLLRVSRPAGSVSDSALILLAYERWGEACVEHLLGDFAFAIWDAQERRLFCARDHFGIRPFYYHHRAGRHFTFATEIKALLTQEGVPERLNEVRLADYLVGMREDAEITIYEEIWRLPPGHTLVVDGRGVEKRRYYEVRPAGDVGEAWTDEAYAERFRELFEEAVRCRLRSAFPVGSELSGGLDSSYVTCVARDVLAGEGRGPLHTISLVFDEVKECDERVYIEEVVKQGGVVPHYAAGDAIGPLTAAEEIYETLDDGLVGNNFQLGWQMLRLAGRSGIRVLLDGIDGDYTVSHGALYFHELAASGRWGEFARMAHEAAARHKNADHKHPLDLILSSPDANFKAFGIDVLEGYADRSQVISFMRATVQVEKHLGIPKLKLFRRYWRRLVAPQVLLEKRRAVRRPKPSGVPVWMNTAFSDRIGLQHRIEEMRASRGRAPLTVRGNQRHILNRPGLVLSYEISSHMAAMSGLESRHPFMDKRLIEFCLALPGRQSLYGGWTRMVMRRAMQQGGVPDRIVWRAGKADLSPNFRHVLLGLDGDKLRFRLCNLGVLQEYISPAYFSEQWSRRQALSIKSLSDAASAATLSLWMQKRFRTPGITGPLQSDSSESLDSRVVLAEGA
ncbi:MAG TPA: lasso peptide isopeptide bond-forming cyclase, partial [Rhodothermales bacterium]|nr:lasso peptide isopeptide bond-forming cyclase [Rhodothermales bacterium]